MAQGITSEADSCSGGQEIFLNLHHILMLSSDLHLSYNKITTKSKHQQLDKTSVCIYWPLYLSLVKLMSQYSD
jgi:hypothetical protein